MNKVGVISISPTMRLILALISTISSTVAQPQPKFENWQLSHPKFTGARLNSVIWGDNACVAIGNNGLILHSPEGSEWQKVSLSSSATSPGDWARISHGAGRFVVVGGNYADGEIATSNDGITWEFQLTGNANRFSYVAYGNNLFVALAGTDVFSSPDGSTWTREADSPGLRCLAYGNGKWIAADSYGRTFSSADLSSWSSNVSFSNFPTYHVQSSIAFGNGRFVIAGGYPTNFSSTSASVLKWSVDGSFWNWGGSDDSETIWGLKTDCVFANDLFVAVGSLGQNSGFRDFYRSPDGKTWMRSFATFPHTVLGYITGVAGAEGCPFVAVSTAGEILVSEDASTWTSVDPSPREYLQALAHAEGKYVAIAGRGGSIGGPLGIGLLLTSSNAIHWTPTNPDPSNCPRSIAHGNGCWVVTGDDGLILRSTDGSIWEDHSIDGTTNDLHLVTHHAGRFIAFSKYRDRIYHSESGMGWEILDDIPVSEIEDVATYHGKLIGAGREGTIYSSDDGLTWTKKIIHPTANFTSVCIGKGRIILSGYDAGAFSENGFDFTVIEPNDENQLLPMRVVYLNGWFIGDNLNISRDGINWQSSSQTGYTPAYGRFEFMITVEDNLMIAEGLEIRSVSFQTDTPQSVVIPGVGLDFLTENNMEYRAHHSTDLVQWTPSGSWREGTNDYIIQSYSEHPDRLFWRIESRELPTMVPSN